jgi:hypothetical protein
MWPRRGVDNQPISSAEVKAGVELYLYSPSVSSWPVLGWTLPFTNVDSLHSSAQVANGLVLHHHIRSVNWLGTTITNQNSIQEEVKSTIVLIFRRTVVLVQHLVSSLSLGYCSVQRLREFFHNTFYRIQNSRLAKYELAGKNLNKSKLGD